MNSQYPDQTTMKVRFNTLKVIECNRLVEKLLVEGKRKASVQVVRVKYSDTNNTTDKMKVRKMILNTEKQQLGFGLRYRIN